MSAVDSRHSRRVVASWAAALVLLAALFALPPGAAANTVTVGCAGAQGGPYNYTSLGGAVAGLNAISYRDHLILVSGTCTEVVAVDWMENIQIVGVDGAVLIEPAGPKTTYAVLAFKGSAGIRIEHLAFRGSDARRALLNVYDSTVEIEDCVFEDSNEGIFVHGRSNVHIRRSVVQDASWYGIRVEDSASVNIGDVDNDIVATVIQRNGTGIIARTDGVANVLGATVIRENQTGLEGRGGTLSFCCDAYERKVIENDEGLSLTTGGKLLVEGPVRIEGNRYGGISLEGASATFLWGQYAIRGNGAVGLALRQAASLLLSAEGVIENHTQAGISLVGSAATVAGNVTVRNNGTLGRALSGGIIAANGSMVWLSTGTTGSVAGNAGPGLLITHNSTARLQRATLSGNQGEGVHVAALSSVLLYGTNSVTGNTGLDLLCTPNSYGSGNKNGVGRMICPTFDQAPMPPEH